jgi:hypothetical protein
LSDPVYDVGALLAGVTGAVLTGVFGCCDCFAFLRVVGVVVLLFRFVMMVVVFSEAGEVVE